MIRDYQVGAATRSLRPSRASARYLFGASTGLTPAAAADGPQLRSRSALSLADPEIERQGGRARSGHARAASWLRR